MTLSEIETTLDELVARHTNLDIALLSTLLQSSGWEDKDIKDAVLLFKQKVSKVTTPDSRVSATPSVGVVDLENKESSNAEHLPVSNVNTAGPVAEITFYDTDGQEEKEIHVVNDAVEKVKIEEKVPPKESLLSGFNIVIPTITVINDLPKEQDNNILLEHGVVKNPTQEIEKTTEETKSKRGENNFITNTEVDLKEKIIDTSTLTPKQEPVLEQLPQPKKPLEEKVHVDVIESKEPQSLVVPEDKSVRRVTKKEMEIPEDLPLLPFESSPHVWSFARYKDVFHGDELSNEAVVKQSQKEVRVTEPPKKVTVPTFSSTHAQEVVATRQEEDEVVEIDLEKTPMTRGDESLVFLAGVMLFAIILILGYMYSNGRL